MLVSMESILQAARAEGYAVAAPNVNNEDTVCAAIEAAEENCAPMIIDIGFYETSNQNIVHFGRFVEQRAKEASVPIAVHLDHAETLSQAVWGIRAGFTSVMVDASMLPYEENVVQTQRLVRMAHAVCVSVESEFDCLGGLPRMDSSALTDPAMAKSYVERTHTDCLAVSVGARHGQYEGKPQLDLDRLRRLRETIAIPLSLHGSSSLKDEELALAAQNGISKINVSTSIYTAGMQWCYLKRPKKARAGYVYIKGGYKNKLIHCMQLFGQCNRI